MELNQSPQMNHFSDIKNDKHFQGSLLLQNPQNPQNLVLTSNVKKMELNHFSDIKPPGNLLPLQNPQNDKLLQGNATCILPLEGRKFLFTF